MTTLAERLANVPARRKPLGKAEAILCSVPEEDFDAVKAALADRGTSAEFVAHTLTDSGYPISASTIRAYRRSLQREVH